jgi:predicted polyphosphate/ATP-dependent NAD kinase
MGAGGNDRGTIVGIIANPVSARDIRRIIANASNLQTAERVNIVLRVLTTLSALGVGRVLMMPDKAGLSSMLLRSLSRERSAHFDFPAVEFIDMPLTSTVDDTFRAVRGMLEAGVRAIVVLGGDGTHRAVVSELLRSSGPAGVRIPIAGLSTGTNNAFPEMREPTVTAQAVGLYATGRISAGAVLAPNKVLEIRIEGGAGTREDIAIVDAVISSDRFVGARAVWKPDSLHSVHLTFADPEVIGLSAIGGLLSPVSRTDPGGLAIRVSDDPAQCRLVLKAPIAPGMMTDIGIVDWETMPADQAFPVALRAGVVALDGERELTFDPGEHVSVTLREKAFMTVDVARCMKIAAREGLFRHSPRSHQ